VHAACARVVAVALLVVSVAASATGSRVADGVRLQLTLSEALPEAARASLVEEVERIWRRERLPLHWQAPDARLDGPGARVRVLVLAGRSIETGDAWPVGELVRDQSGMGVAVVSVAAARRVLDSAGFGGEPDVWTATRLGVVLGRAVAHEIGHFILDMKGHAPYGLMRARVDARDFADLRDGAFGLDRASRSWLRASPVMNGQQPTATH